MREGGASRLSVLSWGGDPWQSRLGNTRVEARCCQKEKGMGQVRKTGAEGASRNGEDLGAGAEVMSSSLETGIPLGSEQAWVRSGADHLKGLSSGLPKDNVQGQEASGRGEDQGSSNGRHWTRIAQGS